jgi:N-methylhydantoinase B/oxoprolinase/acetone carboxylase alpha subunit
MTSTPEQILDDLSTVIADLGSIREKVTDTIDRAAINNQIRALTKWWRKIDDERAEQSSAELDQAKAAMGKITQDLKAEKKKLTNVAVAIHRGAQAIAIAEKVAKLIA